MNALTESTTPWWQEIREAVTVVDVLDALNVQPVTGKGLTANWALPHGMCAGAHGDGRGAVFLGTKTGALHCRKCGESFGPLATIGLALGRDLPKAPWSNDDPDLAAIRAEAEAQGWCTPRLDAPAPRPRPARAPLPSPAPAAPQLSPAQLGAEFRAARASMAQWRPRLKAWCRARGWPADVISAILGYGEPVVPDVAYAGPAASTLHRFARAIDRPLLFAIRDADGLIRSVSRRWAASGAPTDGRPKAMALSTKLVGSSTAWAGECRAFGSIPDAIAKVQLGGRILLVEGSPDYLVASGLCRLGFGDVALAAESAGGLKKIAKALAARLRDQHIRDVEIWCIPDLKRKPTGEPGGDGLTAMRAAAEHLAGVATVREVLLPFAPERDDVDLSDVAATTPDAPALHALLRQRSAVLYEAFPDTLPPRAEGYLPPLPFQPGRVTVLQASLGTGKTYRIGQLIEQLRLSQPQLRVLAINHRRALSRQAAGRFALRCYEDITGPIDDSAVVCLNSLCRVSNAMRQAPQAIIIDEIESVCRQLFGDTLAHHNPERTSSGDVALALKEILRGCLRARGQIILADAHAHPETVDALLRFCGIDASPQWVRHITPAPLSVHSHPSEAALIEQLQLHLEDGKRAALATDSRRRANDVAALLEYKGYRVKTYTGGMCATRRAELCDVEAAWSRRHVDVIVYTPAVDAGVNHDPTDVADRVDAVFGLFTGSAHLGSASIQQMMFRCRNVGDHHVYVANRDDARPCDLDAIRAELVARTRIAEARVQLAGATVPDRAFTFPALVDFEAHIERVARLRAKRLRPQVEAMYTARGAELHRADDLAKAHKQHVNRQLRKLGDKAAEQQAARVLAAIALTAEAYDLARRDHNHDEQTAAAVEKSRLIRQFGPELLDTELAARDARGRVSRQSRHAVALRLALDGHLRRLAERDRLALLGGHGAARPGPDLPVLAGILRCMAPIEWLTRVIAPAPGDMRTAIPDFEWSVESLRAAGLDAWRLLNQIATEREVEPDELLRGVSANAEDLLKRPSMIFNAILAWAGVPRQVQRQRMDGRSPLRVYRVDAERLNVWAIRCCVEGARQRGFAVDPLNPQATPWQYALDRAGYWKAPVDSDGRRLGYLPVDEGWILGALDPEGGSAPAPVAERGDRMA